MNRSDSERIRAVLEDLGFRMVDREEEADLIGVVACSVRQKPIDKVSGKIRKWNEWKRVRPLATFLAGCVLPTDEKRFRERFDIVFRMGELPDLPEMIRRCGIFPEATSGLLSGLERRDGRTDFWRIEPAYSGDNEYFVPIQNGCDKFCTYCAVPYTRGREVSRDSGEVLDEVRRLLDAGAPRITLLGQNVNSYGLDRKGAEKSFPELLDEVGALGDACGREVWIYYTSPHPRDMTRDVLEAMARHPSIADQLHLPIQSGDDEVLRRMNRGYGVEDYFRIVDDVREILPNATLFTDVIVGFSGETEAQFEGSVRAMERARYNMAYVAKYSPRPGARSAEWPDDVPAREKSRRLARLGEILGDTARAWNERLIGGIVRVSIDGPDPRVSGALVGRTEGRIPVRVLDAPADRIGTFCSVRTESAASLSIEGRFVG